MVRWLHGYTHEDVRPGMWFALRPRVGILGYPFGYPFEHCPCRDSWNCELSSLPLWQQQRTETGRRASMTPVRKASKRNTCVMYGRWDQRIPGPMYMRLNQENTKYHNVLHIIFFLHALFSGISRQRQKWVPWFKQTSFSKRCSAVCTSTETRLLVIKDCPSTSWIAGCKSCPRDDPTGTAWHRGYP